MKAGVIGGVAAWGFGVSLGPSVVPNEAVAARLSVDSAWIEQRTGIRSRRWGGNTEHLALKAARLALSDAGVSARDLGIVIVATSTASDQVPSIAAKVADALGADAGGYDLNAACAGSVYALAAAVPTAISGFALVIGADAYSKVLNKDDRGTAILFGDGAGAVVLGPGTGSILSSDNRAVEHTTGLAVIPLAGTLSMCGRDVYRGAVSEVPRSIRRALERAEVCIDDVSTFVLHQANGRMLASVTEALGVSPEKVPILIADTGNTSAASVPITLAAVAPRLYEGDIVVLSGFGAGLSIATVVMRWGGPRRCG